MKNLKINRVESVTFENIQDSDRFAVNQLTDEIAISTKNALYIIKNFEISRTIEWKNERKNIEIISLSFRVDENQIVAILADGKALVIDEDEIFHLEVAEIVDRTASCAEWSPDDQCLAIADNFNIFLADSSLISFSETPLLTSEIDKKLAPVNVGWGSETTQFQGSAGKYKAEKQEERQVLKAHSKKSTIRWRWDGEFVAVSYFSDSDNIRFLKVFDKNGALMSSMNIRNISLSSCFDIKPNANLICSSIQKNESINDLIFFERNGETRNGFRICWPNSRDSTRFIEKIMWNSSGSILAIEICYSNQRYVEFWRVSNYEFTRKFCWKISEQNQNIFWKWSELQDSKFHILLRESSQLVTIDISTIGSYSQSISLNTVIASDEIRISSLCRRAIPPPMCENVIKVEDDICQMTSIENELFVLTKSGKFEIYQRENENSTKFEKIKNIPCEKIEEITGELIVQMVFDKIRNNFIIWCLKNGENQILRIDAENGEIVQKFFEGKHLKICWIGVNENDGKIEIATIDGTFYDVTNEQILFQIPEEFQNIQVFFGKNRHVILTDNSSIYIDSKKITNNVTSILPRNNDVLLIDFDNRLKFIDIEMEKLVEDVRILEIGSELVACDTSSTNVVLQAARGNLEVIQPRKFVIACCRQLLDEKKYVEAFRLMKKHRIDMSFAMEYSGENLIKDSENWFKSSNDSQLLEQLVVSCTEKFEKEGNELCTRIYELIEGFDDKKLKTQYFPLMLTSLLRSTPSRINDCLREINEHSEKIDERKDVFIRQQLHHVSFFVAAKLLFNCALSTYDLKLAQQVAEASNYDPKEYLPVLNTLNQIKCPIEQRYRINVVREDWLEAIRALLELDSINSEEEETEKWWQEAKKIIEREKMQQKVLKVLKSDEKRFKNCCELYGNELERGVHWKEAAMFYELAENHEKTLKCWEMSRDVDGLIATARRLNIDENKWRCNALKMTATLRESRQYQELAKALKLIGSKNRQVIRVLCEGHEWKMVKQEIGRGEDDEIEKAKIIEEVEVAAMERKENIRREVEKRSEEFEKYRQRLFVVREMKLKKMEQYNSGEIDDLRDDVSQISSLSSRSGSSKVSMASSVRKRKQIEKKKSSLKEGGEYEDSALLNVLAENYRWMERIRNETAQLMPLLILLKKINEAFELKKVTDEFVEKLMKSKNGIWPDILGVQNLPGPLYALFEEQQEKSTITMPTIFRLEPELIPPANIFCPIFP